MADDARPGFNRIATDYFHEVGQYPLPTPDEERRLFRAYKKARDARDKAALKGDEPARLRHERERAALGQRIACGYLRFVIKQARHKTKDESMLQELISEGNVGLMTAIDRFDLTKGVRFLTYGAWWINVHMQEFLNRTSLVHVPNHTRKENRKRKLAEEKLIAQGLLADFTVEEPTITNSDPALVASPTDLDELIKHKRFNPLQSFLDAALTRLQRLVLIYYYGLRGGAPKTLGELSQILYELDGTVLTNEAIRQVKEAALKSLLGHYQDIDITSTSDVF